MLETLNNVDWKTIRHAYGEASEIPQIIRTLLSQDKEPRQRAIEQLDNLINHQGTLYEAALYVAPFYVELLLNSETPDKDIIAASFADLAKDISRVEKSDRDYKWKIPVRKIVEDNITILYPFLKSKDEGVRWIIARTLLHFPRYKLITLPLLEEAFIIETDKEVKVDMGKVIKKLQS